VCKCSDVKVTEKATKAHDLELKEIKEAINEAWESEETGASTEPETSRSFVDDSGIESMYTSQAEYSTIDSESGGKYEERESIRSPRTSGAREMS